MRQACVLLIALLVAACSTPGPSGNASQAPARTADIKRATLDIAYSAFVDQDVHHVTSKKALEAALDAVRAQVRAAGGRDDDIATPQFQDTEDPQTADF